MGLPWWPSGQDCELPLQGALGHSQVRELRSCMPRGIAKNSKNNRKEGADLGGLTREGIGAGKRAGLSVRVELQACEGDHQGRQDLVGWAPRRPRSWPPSRSSAAEMGKPVLPGRLPKRRDFASEPDATCLLSWRAGI